MTTLHWNNVETLAMRQRIAQYQAELLDLLYDSESCEHVCQAYLDLVQRVGLGDEVGDVDPRMLALAAHLTKKWGVR
jgi:hypothetical protein